jgi:ribosome-binding protein aMBF1 (putative translation factor)
VNLTEERLNRGLSILALAETIGVPEYVIRHAEKGGMPRPANAMKIASFFGVRVTDIWPTETEPKAVA